MPIDLVTFTSRLLLGFVLGVGIGIERQWSKTRAVLKTNVLVTLGSAMFVMLSIMVPGDSSPTRISAQIVSGVGFLGGGIILKEGANIRGLNTAATLWCAAAIGTLVGAGFSGQAYISTFTVIGANLLLKPLVTVFKEQQRKAPDSPMPTENNSEQPSSNEFLPPALRPPNPYSEDNSSLTASYGNCYKYTCHLLCFPEYEEKVSELLFKFAKQRQLTLIGVQNKNIDSEARSRVLVVEIKANFVSRDYPITGEDSQEIIKLLKTQAKVNSISWQSI